mmetsp:Transcript_39297/g.123908  ORF Transcript_39297/g.123908 Transcript_39297/m.123908 type:complete len:246 (-) Transcript_39297:140-877(-)
MSTDFCYSLLVELCGHQQLRVEGNHQVCPVLLSPLPSCAYMCLLSPSGNRSPAQSLRQKLHHEAEPCPLVASEGEEGSFERFVGISGRLPVPVDGNPRREELGSGLSADSTKQRSSGRRHIQYERAVFWTRDPKANGVCPKDSLLASDRRHHLGAASHHDCDQIFIGDLRRVVGQHASGRVGVVSTADRKPCCLCLLQRLLHCRLECNHSRALVSVHNDTLGSLVLKNERAGLGVEAHVLRPVEL